GVAARTDLELARAARARGALAAREGCAGEEEALAALALRDAEATGWAEAGADRRGGALLPGLAGGALEARGGAGLGERAEGGAGGGGRGPRAGGGVVGGRGGGRGGGGWRGAGRSDGARALGPVAAAEARASSVRVSGAPGPMFMQRE